MADSSQKFIARNRAPRVQIEYDVELYGAEKKVQLPFVMGVMSDLLGKSKAEQPTIADRKFLEIDVDNFDNRMKAMAPRAAFSVPNTLTGEGNLSIDLTFESMKDFSPGAIAAKVDSLRPLLEARTQLQTLMAYMDGKSGAEALIEKILKTPAILSTLSGADAGAGADHTAVLASLRDLPTSDETPDTSSDVLADLAAKTPSEQEETGGSADVLSNLAAAAPVTRVAVDTASDVLGTLAEAEPTQTTDPVDARDAALADLAHKAERDAEDAVLAQLSNQDLSPELPEDIAGLLEGLVGEIPEEAGADDDLDAVLGDLSDAAATEADLDKNASAELDDILAALPPEADGAPPDDDLADVLSGLDMPEVEMPDGEDAEETLESLLGDLTLPEAADETEGETGTVLDDLLADLDLEEDSSPEASALASLLADLDEEATSQEADAAPAQDAEIEANLDDLLADESLADDGDLDFDDLLGDLDFGEDSQDDTPADSDALAGDAGLNDLLADLAGGESAGDLADLDDLLGDLASPDVDVEQDTATDPKALAANLDDSAFAYGTISAARPDAQHLQRRRFRMAVFGDFSGRAARGEVGTGADLAARPAILLDPDTVDEVIAGFGGTLVLPIGETGGVAVKLGELDDLHPDELFENVELFSELVSLRKQLQSGVTVDHASRTLRAWADQFGTPVRVPKRKSAGNAVPADRRLSAFQQLIGDRNDALRQASPLDEMLARVVGPHIRALPDPDVAAMGQAVDTALSDAMRLVLHHPEFQSLEAQWRTLDLIARSVETDDNLEVVLYDVSAEELAADLAAQEDLTESGLVRLLTEAPMDPDLGRGAYSALIGLYSFEETPPHAELLGRIARVAAHVDAPFFAALSPEFLQTSKEDRPKLVAEAWETLQGMSEAGHLGLVSPKFLLRNPYGAKSDRIDAFEFEEFSESEGLKGMLWANPVALVAILLARSFKANGASMQLGSVMSLGGMPYHYVTDQFGDQVALPCTERNIDLDKIAVANARGIMAVSAVKGRDELRLTSFLSVAGAQILGPWTGMPPPPPSAADPREKAGIAAPQQAAPDGASDVAEDGDDDLDLADLDLDDLGLDDLDLQGDTTGAGAEDLDDLDALLAGFGEDETVNDGEGDGDMDAELAALLADL